MKRTSCILCPLAIAVWAVFAAPVAVVAQENEDSTGGAADTGTPGLLDVADNLNLPPVPPQPGAPETPLPDAEPPVLPDTPAIPITEVPVILFANIESHISTAATQLQVELTRAFLNRPQVDDQGGSLFRLAGFGYADNRPRDIVVATTTASWPSRGFVLAANSPDVIASDTNPTTGVTVTAFSNGTFVGVDKSGTTILTGHFAYAPGDRMIGLGERIDGSRFAIYDKYYSVYTADGDVVIGNRFTSYAFDYDQDGTLLSVTDSDDGVYDVRDEGAGVVSVTGPDGYSVYSDETGAFELYDPAGDLVVEGDLNDANHDEFAEFEASSEVDDGGDARAVDDDAVGQEDADDNSSFDEDASGDEAGDGDDGFDEDAGDDASFDEDPGWDDGGDVEAGWDADAGGAGSGGFDMGDDFGGE